MTRETFFTYLNVQVDFKKYDRVYEKIMIFFTIILWISEKLRNICNYTSIGMHEKRLCERHWCDGHVTKIERPFVLLRAYICAECFRQSADLIYELLRDLDGTSRKMRTGNVESWLVLSNTWNFQRHEHRTEYKTKHAAMKFPSTVALLISAHMDGNLKILRIYVSNFIAYFYVRSTLLETYDDTSPFLGTCSAITERRVSVLSNAICPIPLKTANRSS